MFKIIKNSRFLNRRAESAFYFASFLTLFFVMEQFFSFKELTRILLSFGISFIGWYVLNPSVKELEIKNLKVNGSLNEVVMELHKNDMIMHDKIGDYYVFKYPNFLLKNQNTGVFVKEYDKHCVVLLPSKDAVWVEESLKKAKKVV